MPDDVSPADREFAAALEAGDFPRATGWLERGADVNRLNRLTQTFDRDVVEETRTLLMSASAGGEVATVEFLLAHGADPNIASQYAGTTALIEAVTWRQPAVVDVLLAHGAAATTSDRYNGRNALWYAAQNANPPIVRSLLAAGATPDFEALNFSINGGAEAREVVQLLLDHGAEINGIDSWGRTPLMWAAEHAELETVRLLIARGADVRRVSEANSNGWMSYETPLGQALKAKRADVVALLRQHGAVVSPLDRGRSVFGRVWDSLFG